jgi:hypothetical protein
MRALLVGADRLGNIPGLLADHGITIVGHVTGRNPSHQRRLSELGGGVDLVILFTDFLGHNVMKQFRAVAGRAGVPVLACRRSVSCLVRSLAEFGLSGGAPCAACALSPGRA